MRGVRSIKRAHREPPGSHSASLRGQRSASQSREAEGARGISAESAFDSGRLGHRGESPQRRGQGSVCDAHSGVGAAVSHPRSGATQTENAGTGSSAQGFLRMAVLALLSFYRSTLSPAIPSSCRFYPTCSSYAYEAVSQWGVRHGIWLAFRRLISCRPFGGFGYDPVPQSSARSS